AGRAVPTERAFVMAAMALVAILLDRRAISLRTVAAAALVVLVFRPESLVSAGFQMSFSAVVALIWIFGSVGMLRADPQSKWRWILPVAMLILSSLVAGTATAPFAAAHFNRVALYGLVANLLAVPAMGFLVMPGAVILALTAPLGLEAPALFMIEIGSRWILFVADQVANAPGAVSAVITPPPIVLPLIALGGLFIVLWRGKERWLGLAALACAFYLWTGAQRPALLVAESGSLIGLLTEDGRALSRDRADGYAASSWLENDGTINSQAEAAELPGLGPQHGLRGRVLRFELAGNTIMQVRGKMALAEVRGCDGAQIMILTVADEAEGRPCQVWDTDYLRETGALAINIVDGKLEVVSALEQAGARPWTR
ncbi:MAG: ComEC/Rec2 family competence protein, partial [Rhodobacteraceae bacterium]|nr:ComEC/Rec2 family competence protein [Paracoccaceae bacterium]